MGIALVRPILTMVLIDYISAIKFKQNLLSAGEEVALEIFWPPNLVHNLNDVTLIINPTFSFIKHLIDVVHIIKTRASAAQTFAYFSNESTVQRHSLF